MKRTFLIIITFLLIFSHPLFSGIQIESIFFNSDIKVFFIDDFDLTQSVNSPLLFQFTVTNNGATTENISLRLAILYDGLESGETELASGQTNFFPIAPLPEMIIINNQNLYSQSDNYKLENYDINEDAADELINTILTTGKLPSGRYRFLASVITQSTGSVVEDPDPIELHIYNPTSLDLVSPGEPASSTDLMEIYTTLPLFKWESDAYEFWLKVYDASNGNSPEDALSYEPLLDEYITRMSEVMTTFSYQYPSAGVSKLIEGKSYFWQVTALTPSSSGPIQLESEIWGFKIANMSSGASSAEQMQILNYLKLILAEDADLLFSENGELVNFNATGVIMKNGAQLSLEDLNTLVNQFIEGKLKITGHSVE